MVVVVLFQYIVQLIPPMELHILLGLGNDLLKVLKESMVAMGWEPTLQRWMTAIDVKQSKHYGGQFTGNRMKRVLNCLRVSIFSLSGLYLAGRDFSKSQKCRMFCKLLKPLKPWKMSEKLVLAKPLMTILSQRSEFWAGCR